MILVLHSLDIESLKRTGQVVAGLEPEKTNAFLQLLAEAATSKKSPPPQQVIPTTLLRLELCPSSHVSCSSALSAVSLLGGHSQIFMVRYATKALP